ncbi:unnamed protein product [Phytomonas sp. Hart1]|nr:unnamed protein product [Phytomonas sp. Hart1]|eukprot:CCW72029.1 unnamed protein product [Phytomonas sp. isolate Hart1]
MRSGSARAAGRSPFGAGGAPDLTQILKHLPTLLKVARQIPGIFFGFLVTMVIMLVFLGKRRFQEQIIPVAGFHILMLFFIRELLVAWKVGQQRLAAVWFQKDIEISLTKDIGMQYKVSLD